jgi:iron complex transport system permease protein
MKTGKLSFWWQIFLLILPIITGFICLCIGRISIHPAEIFAAFTGGTQVSVMTRMTVLNLRLPRILLAALTGAGLSAAGCAFQSLFANPLATPDTLGVASGASFGAALGLLLGLPILGVQLTALLMGGAAVAMTWVAGSGKSRGLSTVVLAGIMMGSLFNALVSLVKFVADEESQLPAITHWLMGGLNTAAFETLLMGAPLILAGILILGEQFSLLQLVGIVIITLSVFGVSCQKTPSKQS